MSDAAQEVLAITEEMLRAMFTGDPEAHRKYCAEDMSSVEWYIAPYRIDGADFHLRLIEARGNGAPARLDILTPHVQVYNDTAIVTYTLLKTITADDGPPKFSTINETRVFVKQDEAWKMVHLHKSPTQAPQ